MTGTQNIETARIRIDDTYVTLIDTPGFDDTDRTDADILKLIADYLVGTYQNNVLLTGLILLQPISGNRVQGSERRRTRVFE
jgi:predicted GTPase